MLANRRRANHPVCAPGRPGLDTPCGPESAFQMLDCGPARATVDRLRLECACFALADTSSRAMTCMSSPRRRNVSLALFAVLCYNERASGDDRAVRAPGGSLLRRQGPDGCHTWTVPVCSSKSDHVYLSASTAGRAKRCNRSATSRARRSTAANTYAATSSAGSSISGVRSSARVTPLPASTSCEAR